MSLTSTINAATRIRPELVLQVLGSLKSPNLEVMTNVFKKKPNVRGDRATRRIISQSIKAIPYTSQKTSGVPLAGESQTIDSITVPPMKAHLRLEAGDVKAAQNLLGKDYNAWLSDHLVQVRNTITWNMEWLARSFLSNGNCSYKFLVNEEWNTISYSLGTMLAAAAVPPTLFDAAGATLTDVITHLDGMYQVGLDNAGRNDFQQKEKIIIYARTAVWNAIFNLLDGRTTNNVIGSRRLNQDDLQVGGWTIRKFDAATVDPEDQSAGNGYAVKTMRMIDTAAPHSMANLEVENLNATGGQKHVYVGVVLDPKGEFVDIDLQFRPLGMMVPEAMVNSLAVIS
jgi:hypothetical protein